MRGDERRNHQTVSPASQASPQNVCGGDRGCERVCDNRIGQRSQTVGDIKMLWDRVRDGDGVWVNTIGNVWW